jgi:hypothetical protein
MCTPCEREDRGVCTGFIGACLSRLSADSERDQSSHDPIISRIRHVGTRSLTVLARSALRLERRVFI